MKNLSKKLKFILEYSSKCLTLIFIILLLGLFKISLFILPIFILVSLYMPFSYSNRCKTDLIFKEKLTKVEYKRAQTLWIRVRDYDNISSVYVPPVEYSSIGTTYVCVYRENTQVLKDIESYSNNKLEIIQESTNSYFNPTNYFR